MQNGQWTIRNIWFESFWPDLNHINQANWTSFLRIRTIDEPENLYHFLSVEPFGPDSKCAWTRRTITVNFQFEPFCSDLMVEPGAVIHPDSNHTWTRTTYFAVGTFFIGFDGWTRHPGNTPRFEPIGDFWTTRRVIFAVRPPEDTTILCAWKAKPIRVCVCVCGKYQERTNVTSKKRCIFTSTVKLHVKTTERLGRFTNKIKRGSKM